jgi:ABC-type Mn2+/Zn2+ transport system ATPase subunit
VVADGLGKRYRRMWALRGCTLTLPAGRVIALVGPNGAGKTTLLRLLVGLLAPTEGTIDVLGQSPARNTPQGLARIGFVAQDHPLYRRFTVADLLHFGRSCNVRFDSELAHRRLGRLGIPLDRRAGALSGGQQAQVALALALAKRPDLLILDEPLASLDPVARREFLSALMAAVAEDGGRPLDILYGPFAPGGFDIEALMPPAYGLFAFALATAAGLLARRSIPALGAALAGFVVVRAVTATWLRPRYLTPHLLVDPIPADPRGIQIGGASSTDWVLVQDFADATGRRLSRAELDQVEDGAAHAGTSLASYMHQHGIQRWVSYQPAERYWAFQYIEAAIFVGLAALLLGLVVWRVRRRAL